MNNESWKLGYVLGILETSLQSTVEMAMEDDFGERWTQFLPHAPPLSLSELIDLILRYWKGTFAYSDLAKQGAAPAKTVLARIREAARSSDRGEIVPSKVLRRLLANGKFLLENLGSPLVQNMTILSMSNTEEEYLNAASNFRKQRPQSRTHTRTPLFCLLYSPGRKVCPTSISVVVHRT